MRLPALVLYGEKDEVVPAEPTWTMVETLPDTSGSQRVALYRNGYHMLLRDLQAKVVLDDIVAWIAEPGRPLPSGADAHAREALTRRHEG
ncbi:MAG: lysophospholipase [Magnetospirillum sp.]|nr:lysophospholipase [Magnetospirillum sp.]